MVKNVFGSLTGMQKFFDDPSNAKHLGAILYHNSWNNLRWRPFIEKLDDGHAVSNNTVLGGLVNASQYIYVMNGMRYVMRKQATASVNSMIHALEEASKGNVKSRQFFSRYGIDDEIMANVKQQFDQHGWYVDKWDEGVFESIRAPLMTIVDEDVLRARTGEVPEVAQFSSVGRAMFTFRSFIMTSHNKILASNLANDGVKGMAVIFAYQSMLSAMMVQLANVAAGRGVIEDNSEWATRAVAMMGGAGLLSEAWSALRSRTEFGNPFVGSTQLLYDVAGLSGEGEFSKAAQTAVSQAPMLTLIPGWGAAVKYAFGD